MTDKPQTAPSFADTDSEFLERMGARSPGDIAREIVVMVRDKTEDDHDAVKYGRRMIEALINIKLREAENAKA